MFGRWPGRLAGSEAAELHHSLDAGWGSCTRQILAARSSFCGICGSLRFRAFAGSRTLATGGAQPRRTPLSPSMWHQAGVSERWQHERTTLA
eukprot:8401908-Alexandrium_andersonii.AAC.1